MTVADYTKVDAIAAADIVKINGVAKGSIVKCGGATTPASGATRWVCAGGNALPSDNQPGHSKCHVKHVCIVAP